MSSSIVVLRRVAFWSLVVAIGIATVGIGRLSVNSHYTAYFDKDDPRLVSNTEIQKLYCRHDGLFVILQSTSSFLNVENYRLLEDLTARLAIQPLVSSALSITELGIDAEVMTPEGDYIPGIAQLAEDNRAIGLLLAKSTRLAGIWVQIALPDNRSGTIIETLAGIRQEVDRVVGDRSITTHYSGTLALNEAYINVVRRDLALILPLLLLTIVIVLGGLLRNRKAVLTMLPVGMFSVVTAFGVAGLFGAELSAINAFAPIIILSISIAGCVHMSLSYAQYRGMGRTPSDAAIAAASYNLLPMSLANGTTALGFLGLSLSSSPPVRMVGYLVAIGIVISFILCLTLLPVLQQRFDPWSPVERFGLKSMSRLAAFTSRYRTALITVFVILMLPAGYLASRNAVSDNVFDYFQPSHQFHSDTKLVEDHLSGVNEVLFSVDSGAEFGMLDAQALEALDRFANWLGRQPEVNHVVSITDTEIVQEAWRENRLQDRLDFYRSRVESGSFQHPQISLAVSPDFSSSVVTAYLKSLNSSELIDFDRATRLWADENLPGFELQSGGPTLMFAYLSEQNIHGMLTALLGTLVISAVLLGLVLRSRRAAWIGLICNLCPVLFVYSVWAVVNGEINLGAAVVLGMILGIVLDDTIYLLATHRRGQRLGVANAVEYTLSRVGPALITTTITLITGLSLGLLSDFGPIWNMSILSVTVIGTALIVDLLLLPAMLSSEQWERSYS